MQIWTNFFQILEQKNYYIKQNAKAMVLTKLIALNVGQSPNKLCPNSISFEKLLLI